MKKVLGSKTDDRELEKLFMKVDTNCDGTVDWDEFLSYMLLEYLEKDLIKVRQNSLLVQVQQLVTFWYCFELRQMRERERAKKN